MDLQTGAAIASIVGAVIALLAWLVPKAARERKKSGQQTNDRTAPYVAPTSEPTRVLIVGLGLAMIAPTDEPETVLMVDVANADSRPRQITSVGLQLETKQQVAFTRPGSDRGLPCVLGETEKVHYWASPVGIARTMCQEGLGRKQQVRAMVRDSYDERHYSAWVEFDPVFWSKQ